MKGFMFFAVLGLLATGCGGNQNENTDTMNDRHTQDEPGYRSGTIPADTVLVDTVDSVLPPTTPPTTP